MRRDNDTPGEATRQASGGKDAVLAAGIILWRRGAEGKPRFLLLETRKGGHWSPPKGHLDDGESYLDAARRETREECGLEATSLDPVFKDEIQYMVTKKGKQRWKRVAYFLGEAGPGEVRLSDEHTAHRWVTPLEARSMIEHESLSRVIERAALRLDVTEAARREAPGGAA